MATTLHRRQSMAQLYEKLRAQDDDDDMAWLAQYSPDEKFDEPYVPPTPNPPSLCTISSVSPISSYSSPSSMSDPTFDADSNEEYFDFDSDSDVDPEPTPLDLCTVLDSPSGSPVIADTHDLIALTEPSDLPFIPQVRETSATPSSSRSTPTSVEFDSSPVHVLPTTPPASYRFTRSRRDSSVRNRSAVVIHDSDDAYSEGDDNGSEDEYVPIPAPGSKKRQRSTRSGYGAVGPSSRKRATQGAPRKRPHYSPYSRNIQATPGVVPESPVTKSNPWACPYCKWVQRNHRTPDLKRHIRTHTRLQRPAQWICCGVPVEDAKYYKFPVDAEPYLWEGEEMIGGCCKEFSRRDALKRHLDNDHINCIGNFAAFASICEDEV